MARLHSVLKSVAVAALLSLTLTSAPSVQAQGLVRVTVTNLAPANGTFLTPVWVGFHNGTFDIYDSGSPAAPFLEAIAEDGNTAPITAAFGGSGAGTEQGTLGGGPIAPGASVTGVFLLNGALASSMFFSYASMIIPSNDAFIGNGNPTAFQVFDGGGNFLGVDFIVAGAMILDSGTEVNDEIPANTAFLGQAAPNTGTTEGGVVGTHPGFTPGGNILTAFPGADFTQSGYQVARITITAVAPEPTSLAFLGVGALALGGVAIRRRRQS